MFFNERSSCCVVIKL